MIARLPDITTRKACFLTVVVFFLFFMPGVSVSSVVSVVATGKVAYTGALTAQVRKTAVENMEINAIKQVLKTLYENSDKAKTDDFIRSHVLSTPDMYVENYKILAELKSKNYFQLTGKVDVIKDSLIRDFEGKEAEESTEKQLALVLLVTEFNPRTNEWEYWWKMPPDRKQKLYFTNQLGKELRSRNVLLVYKVGREKILLQSTNFQTPFITTDAAIQLGLIYRTPFVVTGNLHINSEGNRKNKCLVASLQIISTDNGESIAEIIEKKKVRATPRRSNYLEMAKAVAPRIVDEMKGYLEKSASAINSSNTTGSTSQNFAGQFLVTIEISNVTNLHPLEVLQRYFTSEGSPVIAIKSITLEHRKVLMKIISSVDGTLLARRIMSDFPNDEEFSILSSREDSIKISSSYSGAL